MAEDDKRAERKTRSAAEKRTASSKAQVEMKRYRARRAAEAEAGAVSPFPGPTAWAVHPAAQGTGTGWPLPPSVMTYPAVPQGGIAMPGGPLPQATTSGSLAQGLGSTLGLGVEAVNTLLYGGIRLMQGMAAMTYGYSYGQAAHGCGCGGGGCGCGCGCGYDCGSPCCGQDCCCGYDCCTVFGSCGCCQPSVGNCC
jgi:hypothetical protein